LKQIVKFSKDFQKMSSPKKEEEKGPEVDPPVSESRHNGKQSRQKQMKKSSNPKSILG
jgi:hypothetical protein